ncbi:MAG: ABC transporter substrate-binding protein [Nocardioidaceae bacterium]|nr:ABC transporter substrate-binding protein [Nocardioidaceae bacterium]
MSRRNSNRQLVPLTWCLAGLLLVAACGGRGSDADTGGVKNDSGVKVAQVVKKDDCTGYQASPGISDDEIKLGSSYPDSGPLASIGETNKGMESYFKHLNESGGINGRKITLIGKDDQYDPTKASANVNELLQKDRVFAIVGVQSTTGTMAVWDQLARECVPILESTISSATRDQRAAHRNAIDGLVPYASEGYALAGYLTKTLGEKKVAVITQDGSFGDAAARGVERAIEENGGKLVAHESFQVTDPTVRSQVTTLKASGADALVVIAAGTKCPQIFDTVAASGWKPTIATTFTCSNTTLMGLAKPASTDGIISDGWVRVRTADDPESKTFLDAVKKYAPGVNASSENVAIGWAQGQIVAAILERATELTRVGVINSALGLDGVAVPMAVDGVKASTSADDSAPIESVQIRTFDSAAGAWTPVTTDALVDMTGKLGDFE